MKNTKKNNEQEHVHRQTDTISETSKRRTQSAEKNAMKWKKQKFPTIRS